MLRIFDKCINTYIHKICVLYLVSVVGRRGGEGSRLEEVEEDFFLGNL
jgi:hypothetical protein